MKRITSTTRRLIRLLLCVPVAALFLGVCPAAEKNQQTRRPNFIFILSDDVAQGDLGCYGQELIQTPNLANDSAESVNLAATRPDLVERALEIFVEAHRPDPNWPLFGHSAKQKVQMREAWKSLHGRRDRHWAPADALPYQAPEE